MQITISNLRPDGYINSTGKTKLAMFDFASPDISVNDASLVEYRTGATVVWLPPAKHGKFSINRSGSLHSAVLAAAMAAFSALRDGIPHDDGSTFSDGAGYE